MQIKRSSAAASIALSGFALYLALLSGRQRAQDQKLTATLKTGQPHTSLKLPNRVDLPPPASLTNYEKTVLEYVQSRSDNEQKCYPFPFDFKNSRGTSFRGLAVLQVSNLHPDENCLNIFLYDKNGRISHTRIYLRRLNERGIDIKYDSSFGEWFRQLTHDMPPALFDKAASLKDLRSTAIPAYHFVVSGRILPEPTGPFINPEGRYSRGLPGD